MTCHGSGAESEGDRAQSLLEPFSYSPFAATSSTLTCRTRPASTCTAGPPLLLPPLPPPYPLLALLHRYVHRAGRTGRLSSLTAGHAGVVVSLVGSPEERAALDVLLEALGVEGHEVRALCSAIPYVDYANKYDATAASSPRPCVS